MRKYTMVLLLIVTTASTKAQTTAMRKGITKFSLGPELGYVVGVNSNFYSISIGGSGEIEMGISERFAGTLTSGVNVYQGKKIFDFRFEDLRVIPLKAGVRYYFKPNFYGGAQAGAGFFNNDVNTKFGYSTLLGYQFGLGGNTALDLSLKTDAYTGNGGSIASITTRLALRF